MYAYSPMTVCTYYTHCVALQQDTVRGSNLETWEICVSNPLELLQVGGFCRNLLQIREMEYGKLRWIYPSSGCCRPILFAEHYVSLPGDRNVIFGCRCAL